MPEQPKTEPAVHTLNFPDLSRLQPADLPGGVMLSDRTPAWDKQVPVRYMNHLDLVAVISNLAMIATAFTAIGWPLLVLTTSVRLSFYIAFCFTAIGCLIAISKGRGWTTVKLLQANVFQDYLLKRTIAYVGGFHITSFFAGLQTVVEFKNRETISLCRKDDSAIEIQCGDGLSLEFELKCFFNVLDFGGAFLGNAIKYSPEERRDYIQAAIESRLGDLAGLNTYKAMLANKDIVTMYVAGTFGGENVLSPLEMKLGVHVQNPIVESIDLTEASKKIFGTSSKADQVVATAHKFEGLSKTSVNAALATAEVAQMTIASLDVPESVENVAFGGGAFAGVTSNSGGKRNRKGNKGKPDDDDSEE